MGQRMQTQHQRRSLDLRKGFSRFLLTVNVGLMSQNLHLPVWLADLADNERHLDWREVVGIGKISEPRINLQPVVQPTDGTAPRHVRKVQHRQLRLVIGPDFKRFRVHANPFNPWNPWSSSLTPATPHD